MSYMEYRAQYRQADRDAFLRRFATCDMPYRFAQAYAVGRARRQQFLCMDDVLQIQKLCMLEHLSAEDLLMGEPLPLFKQSDDVGCKTEDAHGLCADFVQECNALGRNNPLFYGAYVMGTFCSISPFEKENLAVACALCNFYLVARDMPPILFGEETICDLEEAARVYRQEENITALKEEISRAAEATFSVLCANTCKI